jgi:hypothetical protein
MAGLLGSQKNEVGVFPKKVDVVVFLRKLKSSYSQKIKVFVFPKKLEVSVS